MVKDGRKHIESLRDGRRIFIDGTLRRRSHHSIRPSATPSGQPRGLYDYQAQPENLEKMTFASPKSGDRVSRMWQLPTSQAELVERRQALEAWAELTCGMLGRSPDHVASCISGMYMGLDLFERHSAAPAAAVRDYYEYARDNDLYLTYVIISPAGRPQQERGRTVRRVPGCRRLRRGPRKASRSAAPRCSARRALSPTKCSSAPSSR